MTDPRYLGHLRQRLDQGFDEEELRTLVFELGISYDNIAGTTKSGKTRELVAALDRQGRIPELIDLCARFRPHLDWPYPPQPKQTPPAVDTTGSYAPAPQQSVPSTGAMPIQPATQAKDDSRRRKFLLAGLALIALFAIILVIGASAAIIYFSTSGDQASLEGMVSVPEGTYLTGRETGGADHEPETEIALNAYWIDRYEVTNARYADFVDAEGQPPASWSAGNFAEGEASFPVTGITWDMADAYCKWLNKRLPSEAEWEAAARGDQALLYPWGDSADQVTLPSDSPYRVGTFLADHSPFGLFDAVHNVHEWVGEPYAEVQSGERVLRGGSGQLPVDLTTRIVGDPSSPTMIPRAGFRCAVDGDWQADSASPDLLFLDEFTDPDSGWTVGSGDNPGYHAPDWYHLEARDSEPIVLLGPEGNSNRGDLSIVTEIFQSVAETVNDGDFRYGLIARKSDDQSYYAFMISPNSKTWSVVKQTPDGPMEIASGQNDSIAGLDQRNWLRLDASDQTFLFWVNDRLVYQFSDPEAPATGDIGYIVESLGASKVHVHVDYMEVTELPPNPIPAAEVEIDS